MAAPHSGCVRNQLSRVIRPTTPLAAKVPEITVLFWVIKILTTGMGEAASDFLGDTNLALGGIVGVGGFVLAMRWQFAARSYRAQTYWFAVAMVATFGTMVADVVHVAGLPYPVTTALYGAAVAYVFVRWNRSEGTLSIHSITTTKREQFYWLTVLATFALGTAAGDLTAATFNFGFLDSGILFGVAILVPLIAWKGFGASPVAMFWVAYVLTRPLGASFADWMGKPKNLTGLDWGDGPVAGIAALLIIALVTVVARTRSDVQAPVPVLEPA